MIKCLPGAKPTLKSSFSTKCTPAYITQRALTRVAAVKESVDLTCIILDKTVDLCEVTKMHF